MKIQKCTRVTNRNPGPARRVLEWRRNFLPSRRRLRFNFSHEVTRTTVASQRLSRVWLIVGPWGRLLVTDHWAAGNFHVCNIPLWQNRLWFYCGDHGSSESLDPLSQIYCDTGKTWLPTSSSFLRSHGRWLLGDINSSVPSSKTSVYYGPYWRERKGTPTRNLTLGSSTGWAPLCKPERKTPWKPKVPT